MHKIIRSAARCHELFMHPTYGRQAADLAVRLIKRGRKYGIILILATQSPTKDSIPREITRNISTGVAFAVADHVANDGLLGAGKYKAGIRATDLRMRTDRGTSVAVGVTSNLFELLRWFYIRFEDGHDDVTPIIARALALVAEHGARTIPTRTAIEPPAVPVDHLADIHAALGDQRRVRTQVVLTRLAEANPDEYESWTFTDLRAASPHTGWPGQVRRGDGPARRGHHHRTHPPCQQPAEGRPGGYGRWHRSGYGPGELTEGTGREPGSSPQTNPRTARASTRRAPSSRSTHSSLFSAGWRWPAGGSTRARQARPVGYARDRR